MSRAGTEATTAERTAPTGDASNGGSLSRPLAAHLTGGVAGVVVASTALWATGRLGAAGSAVGLGCAAVLAVLVHRGVSRAGRDRLLPGDVVTFARALLACVVAALTTESVLGRSSAATALVTVAAAALALDAVDGSVARRTGTVTPFGGRFDGEADAFLILVLSLAAAHLIGWWVLGAGLARYAFAVAGWALPWLRRELDFRHWRKVVTAVVGIALTTANATIVPRPLAATGAVVALVLLGESFGRDVLWLWRRRLSPAPSGPGAPHVSARKRRLRAGARRLRAGASRTTAVAALGLSWCALVAPARPNQLTPLAFLRLPVEAVVVAGLVLIVPTGARRLVATLAGVGLGTLALSTILDLATYAVLDRPFDIATDIGTIRSGLSFAQDGAGTAVTIGSAVGGLVILTLALVGIPWAVRRTAAAAAAHRTGALQAVVAGATVWTAVAVIGVQGVGGRPVAAAQAGPYAVAKVGAVTTALRDRAAFERALAEDPFHDIVSTDLSALSGKDVLVVFVESYGRVALEGPAAASVREVLDGHTARLAVSGLEARSAFLTSPTFGGSSWLAHATLQSGLWVDNQARYDQLLASDRATLTSAFAHNGWRTVALLPSTRGGWPDGRAFYRYDAVYGRTGLGYAGPTFGFSAMPDQYALAAFNRLELSGTPRAPVMAEIDLTSSHAPWAPLPRAVGWDALGDGSVFGGVRAQAESAAELWSDPADVPAAYRASIAYSLSSMLSFAERPRDHDLVVVLLGDHQPAATVSGFGADHDVPVSIIARDPAVLAAASSWGWVSGLVPGPAAPVWPMNAVRDRFLTDFSSGGPASQNAPRP